MADIRSLRCTTIRPAADRSEISDLANTLASLLAALSINPDSFCEQLPSRRSAFFVMLADMGDELAKALEVSKHD